MTTFMWGSRERGKITLKKEDPQWELIEREPDGGEWLYIKRMRSFAPPRSGVGKWLLEGATRFADLVGCGLWAVALSPPEGGIGQDGLEALYQKFGFEKCPDWTKVFIRFPKGSGGRA